MANNGASTAFHPTRPKHHYSRSLTDISVATLGKTHHKLHHHPAHLHRKDDKSLSLLLSPPQQGGQLDGWTSEAVTPNESLDGSRRPSLFVAGQVDELGGISTGPGEMTVVKEGQVKQEKERGVLRAEELRQALSGLNTLANDATRRLDTTYYSVLEKLSTLQGTISVLKELSASMKQVNEDFNTETEHFVKDVTNQLDGFHNFTTEQKTIERLQARVVKGRETIKALGDKVNVVKDRVDHWEKSEISWQERTRRRLKILWIIMSICGAVFIALIVFQYTPARTHTSGVITGWNTSALVGKIPGLEDMLNETFSLTRSKEHTGNLFERKDGNGDDLKDDPRLKLFDEL